MYFILLQNCHSHILLALTNISYYIGVG